MKEKKKLIIKRFNFAVNDRVRSKTTAPKYGTKSYPKDMEGTLVGIRRNGDVESTNCPLYIVWDNETLSANTLQDIELVEEERLKNRYIYNLGELYFEDFVPTTPEEVLPHLYSGGYKTSLATYYKNEFGMLLHCVKGKLRSFDDIYYLFKAYFPEETFESVFKRMLLFGVQKSEISTRNMGIQLSECSTMKRIRYIPFGSTYNTNDIWRAAMEARQYESITHWRHLFKLLNINSVADLNNWYKEQFKTPAKVPLILKA